MDTFNILHISDQGLPDWRIEKSALSAKKRDHNVFFAGLPFPKNNNTFDRTFSIEWNYKARYYYPNFDPQLSMIFLISLGIWLGTATVLYKIGIKRKSKP